MCRLTEQRLLMASTEAALPEGSRGAESRVEGVAASFRCPGSLAPLPWIQESKPRTTRPGPEGEHGQALRHFAIFAGWRARRAVNLSAKSTARAQVSGIL